MANDCIKFKEDGDHITCEADAAPVTGKRFVYVSGTRTSTFQATGQGAGLVADASVDKSNVYRVKQVATLGQRGLGVAAFDAASGQMVNVIRTGIVPVTAGAAITAGQELMNDTQGRVTPWIFAANMVNAKVGMAMADQATVGNDAEVLLYEA
jgi:predicted RecA/RadA family phage recombinase